MITGALLVCGGPASTAETYVAHLSSAKTGTGSPAEGTAVFVLSDDLSHVDYNVSYSGLLGSATECHAHRKGAGIAYDIGTANPAVGTWEGISAEDIERLRGAELYVNVHSDLYNAGEIQGTLLQGENPVDHSTWGRIKALYRR
jgi:hypothetical protein